MELLKIHTVKELEEFLAKYNLDYGDTFYLIRLRESMSLTIDYTLFPFSATKVKYPDDFASRALTLDVRKGKEVTKINLVVGIGKDTKEEDVETTETLVWFTKLNKLLLVDFHNEEVYRTVKRYGVYLAI